MGCGCQSGIYFTGGLIVFTIIVVSVALSVIIYVFIYIVWYQFTRKSNGNYHEGMDDKDLVNRKVVKLTIAQIGNGNTNGHAFCNLALLATVESASIEEIDSNNDSNMAVYQKNQDSTNC